MASGRLWTSNAEPKRGRPPKTWQPNWAEDLGDHLTAKWTHTWRAVEALNANQWASRGGRSGRPSIRKWKPVVDEAGRLGWARVDVQRGQKWKSIVDLCGRLRWTEVDGYSGRSWATIVDLYGRLRWTEMDKHYGRIWTPNFWTTTYSRYGQPQSPCMGAQNGSGLDAHYWADLDAHWTSTPSGGGRGKNGRPRSGNY